MVRHFLKRWEARDRDLPGLLRVCITHRDGRALLLAVFRKQITPVIARVTGPRHGAERAALISTQMLGLALTRYVLELPPVVGLSQDTIVAHVGATLQGYLTDGLDASPRPAKRTSRAAVKPPAKSASRPASPLQQHNRHAGGRRATIG